MRGFAGPDYLVGDLGHHHRWDGETDVHRSGTWADSYATLMPMTWPVPFANAPPELPGLMGASVWIRLLRRHAFRAGDARDAAVEPGYDAQGHRVLVAERAADGYRVFAYLRHLVTKVATGSFPLGLTLTTARSVSGSRPTIVRRKLLAGGQSHRDTVTGSPLSSVTMWLLVMIMPSAV